MIVPKYVAISLAVYSGLAIILQNGVNCSLQIYGVQNPFAVAGVSYTVGLFTISIISVIERPPQSTTFSIHNAPWYAYLGGPLGAVYVTSAILLVPRLGFATFQLAVTLGQLTSSMICDAVGFLYLKVTPATPWRVLCLLLLALGTALSTDWEHSGDENVTDTPMWIIALYAMGATIGGALFPIQSCVNFVMTRHLGTPYRAVMVSFAGGCAAVWLLTGLSYCFSETMRNAGPIFISNAKSIPLWMWLGGGLLGATFITSAVIGLPALGAVAFTGIFISTQLVVATIFDSVGAFGFDPVPVWIGGGRRVVGVAFAVIAAGSFQMAPPQSVACLETWSLAAPSPDGASTVAEKKPLAVRFQEEGDDDDDPISASYGSIRDSHFV